MQTSSNPKKSYLVPILKKIADNIGAKITIEPTWHHVGKIEFSSGVISYFNGTSLDVNTLGAAGIAKDKDFSRFFLDIRGYPTVPGETFFSDTWAEKMGSSKTLTAAVSYVESVGYPRIVKPNNGSQGQGVFRVENESELRFALGEIFKEERVALIQPIIAGDDYRILIYDGSLIAAYRRSPLHVTGNGISSVRELIEQKQVQFYENGRSTRINTNDLRMMKKLERENHTLETIPVLGETMILLDNANLSSGGEAEDVTELVHPSITQTCITITKDMGLRLCGVDLLVQGEISDEKSTYVVLEINASPGLDNFRAIGPKQEKLVEEFYERVLRDIEAGEK